MGNCTKTKFKGSMNNPDLEKYGYYRIRNVVANANNSALVMQGTLYDKDYNLVKNVNGYTALTNGTEYMLDQAYSYNEFDLQYGYIKHPNELAQFKAITHLGLRGGNANYTYNINEILSDETCLIITNFHFEFNYYVLGAVESFVERCISLGRTSGTVEFTVGNPSHPEYSLLKLHNLSCPYQFSISFSGNTATVVSGGNTIATYDGTSWTYNN